MGKDLLKLAEDIYELSEIEVEKLNKILQEDYRVRRKVVSKIKRKKVKAEDH